MRHVYTSSAAMILLVMAVVPRLNGQTYEEEVLSDEPVVYYRFEESEAGQATDASGNDNHGEYVGGVELDQPSAAEGIGSAALFDGATGFVQMNPLELETDQVTIETWVNLELLAGGCCTSLFSPDGWEPGWLHYNLKDDANIEFALNSGGPNNHNTQPGSVPFNEWTHIASVYDKDEALVRTFVNGEEVDVFPPGFATPQTMRLIASAQVGAWQNTRFLGGLMDEFAIYDSALSEERIVAHFEAADRISSGPRFKRGDADADGGINLTDGVLVLNFLFAGGERVPPCADAADTDDSGSITITDGILILNFLFLGKDDPPAPFAECGTDPTEDRLDCVSFDPCA